MRRQGRLSVTRGDLPDEFADAFSRSPRVAWDVETSGLDWRQDRLGTCQMFADEVGVVVVSLAEAVPGRLAELLENPAVEKVFHHAPFDLRFMSHEWGARQGDSRITYGSHVVTVSKRSDHADGCAAAAAAAAA